MRCPLTAEEVGTAAKQLKNNTLAGIDNVTTEMIKYAPVETHAEIAEILNLIAETGESPSELLKGIINSSTKARKEERTYC